MWSNSKPDDGPTQQVSSVVASRSPCLFNINEGIYRKRKVARTQFAISWSVLGSFSTALVLQAKMEEAPYSSTQYAALQTQKPPWASRRPTGVSTPLWSLI